MKKLLILIMALAMTAAFVPGAYTAESAHLGLQVTFAANEPLKISADPEGPFTVEAGKTVEFRVIAEDKDAVNVMLKPYSLPEGAEWIVDPVQPISINHRDGTFKWTPKVDSNANEIGYVAVFGASNGDEKVDLKVEIRVINLIISIELNEPYWKLEGVKLGEKRTNLNELGVPIHMIKNTGNVPVSVGIRYVNMISIPENPQPGLEQGLNTFITMLRESVISPDVEVPVVKGLAPTDENLVRLTYGAPTGVMNQIQGMSAAYELRAYKAIEPGPYPIEPIVLK